jgi:hypothetical protein
MLKLLHAECLLYKALVKVLPLLVSVRCSALR